MVSHFAQIVLLSWLLVPPADNWPDFRGPEQNGYSQCSDRLLPLTWSEHQHVVWKTAIEGRGWSSPVIWGEQVWLTTATPAGHHLSALCVNRTTGELLHRIGVFDVEHPQEVDPTNSYASPSPVIEPGRVYVHFGTYGTACLDAQTGRVMWQRRDLPVDHQKGPGSSPVLYRDLLIFPRDGNDIQCLEALDKHNGAHAWTTPRTADLSRRDPDYRKSFSTPLLVRTEEKDLLVSTAAGAVYGYDPATGRELWRVGYGGHTMVSRPVYDAGLLVINTGYPRPELWGLRLHDPDAVSDADVLWRVTRNVSIKPSVLLHEGLIYMITDAGGIVSCLDALSGRLVWRERVGGNYAASPVLVGQRIYFFSQEGRAVVIRAGRSFEKLAENQLDQGLMASPAVVHDALLLRTKTHLYRIGF